MSKEGGREPRGAVQEGKEPMEGEVAELRCACGEDRLINTHQPVVIASEEGKVAEWSSRVSDNASDRKCARLWRKGWSVEVVEDRPTEGTKNG